MLVPVKWLRDYVNVDATTREIAERVTNSGSHVESINKHEELSGLVVAEVLDIKKHENADKLSLVELNHGDGTETIVTGAKNMQIGDKLVLAKLGAKLANGVTINEAEFQGFVSKGMLCSYNELGVSENTIPKNMEDGLIILDNDAEVGRDALEVLDLYDQIIEFEITPNRPDCLSIIGMAREVAAVFDTKIEEPSTELNKSVETYSDYFDGVELQTDLAKRFITAIVKDVTIKDSPQYIQNYLRNAGMRPINNIVDFTNFIMLEYGQPLHAYDLDTIKNKKLIVRLGKDGEEVKTIDEKTRKIEAEDIVIADGESNPIGLAGVMGGFDTEVTSNTKNILIEAACFDSESIRKTSKRLALRSEASSRFEKGIPEKLSEYGIKRFLKLIEETNSGTVINDFDDQGNFIEEDKIILLRNFKSNSLLGLDLDIKESEKYLNALDLETKIVGEEIEVKIPYFRSDLEIEADLIEEIGRLYGFHNIKPKALSGELTQGLKSDLRNFTDKVKREVYGLGFSEIVTYSFISRKQFDKLNIPEDSPQRKVLEILNPLGEDFSVMRTSLIGNLLEVIRKNINNKQKDLRLSEVGNAFIQNGNTAADVSEEKLLVMALVGDEYSYFDLKDNFENLLSKLGVQNYKFVREENNPSFHPGRTSKVQVDGQDVAILGEIHPIVLDNFDISERVYVLEANLNTIKDLSIDIIQYEKISKYPLVERDIAFVIDKNIDSQEIVDVFEANGGEYLKFVKLFDRYEGEQIEDGKVSLAYKLGFQSSEATLTEEQIKESFEKATNALAEKFEIEFRS